MRATREVDGVALGASVRGSLALERTARAWALVHGREHVAPEDVEQLFLPVLGHRLLLQTRPTSPRHAASAATPPSDRSATVRSSSLPPPAPGSEPDDGAPMPARERRTFPLVPLRRRSSARRSATAGAAPRPGRRGVRYRPYGPGDPRLDIDWPATARLSAAPGTDEFVVRSKAVDEAPRVVLVLDRRPAMSLDPRGLPWLAKAGAVAEATAAIVHSAEAVRADLGALDFAAGEERWLHPRGAVAWR